MCWINNDVVNFLASVSGVVCALASCSATAPTRFTENWNGWSRRLSPNLHLHAAGNTELGRQANPAAYRRDDDLAGVHRQAQDRTSLNELALTIDRTELRLDLQRKDERIVLPTRKPVASASEVPRSNRSRRR